VARLAFVCWGNICRSPMAERVARKLAQGTVIESFGISTEELGNPIDRRAARTLTAAGYDASGHRARQITREDLLANDLVVAVEPFQVDRLLRIAPEANVALLNDFDPAKPKGTPLIDPWYGDDAGFADTLADIEAAMPGILAALVD
jgi:protein-tyrosine phosphatase